MIAEAIVAMCFLVALMFFLAFKFQNSANYKPFFYLFFGLAFAFLYALLYFSSLSIAYNPNQLANETTNYIYDNQTFNQTIFNETDNLTSYQLFTQPVLLNVTRILQYQDLANYTSAQNTTYGIMNTIMQVFTGIIAIYMIIMWMYTWLLPLFLTKKAR